MTQAITPKSATNRLSIEATVMCSSSVANQITVALFKDATANALAANALYQSSITGLISIKLSHDVLAGSVSSATYRIRLGQESAGTISFNGQGGVRRFGGITVSNIKITEYKA
jgi:hypothetical protein